MNELINQTDTAKQSYATEQPLVRTINDKVEAWIRNNGELSRNDIQRDLGLTSRQAGCAVWHLIRDGKIKPCGEKTDGFTGHIVEVLCINPNPELKFTKKSNAEKLKEIKELCENTRAYMEVVPYTTVSGLCDDILKIINE